MSRTRTQPIDGALRQGREHGTVTQSSQQVGVFTSGRITEHAYLVLRAEQEQRREREAANTSIGKLITEATMAHFGPKHRDVLANNGVPTVTPKRSTRARSETSARKGAA